MDHTRIAAAAFLLGGIALAPVAQARPLTVLELFTSESCSSCPPADALLTQLARERPDVLALTFHVTYWDRLGWKDPFSLPAATERQHAYASLLGSAEVYTPQLLVNGTASMVGSDAGAIAAALRAAPAREAVPLTVTRHAGQAVVAVGAGSGTASLLLVGYDPEHVTAIGGGENGGRSLTETNIVRGMVSLGAWQGENRAFSAAAPAGERLAVLLQAPSGEILAAATTP